MDNAGGHGRKDIKGKYANTLKEKYNIQVEWQCSCSPETNMLDLGFWRSLQASVEHMHQSKNPEDVEALARSVEDAWLTFDDSGAKMGRIAERWYKVLDLIILGQGSNELVEKNRGLTSSLHTLPKNIRHNVTCDADDLDGTDSNNDDDN